MDNKIMNDIYFKRLFVLFLTQPISWIVQKFNWYEQVNNKRERHQKYILLNNFFKHWIL